ncbi:MAG: ABC transporter substrate-binding protein [Acidobacteriota bacterium]
MKSARTLSLLIVLTLLGTTACAPPPEPIEASDEPRRGGQIVIGTTADMGSTNPLIVGSNRPTDMILRHVYLQLVRERADFESGPPSFAPDLAESWQWSEDHKVVTFALRQDARWSDGTPVTAADVRFTWQAQMDPDIAWDTAYAKESITDVEVVDQHTVRVHFDRVYPNQMLDLNESYILPQHLWGRVPFAEWRQKSEWFRDNAVYSGAFEIASWTPQQEIVLERNEAYYDPELPRLDRVIYRIVPDQTNHVTQLLSGSIDMAGTLSPENLERLEEQPHIELRSFWGPSYIFIAWNQRSPLFQERDVREALTLAIDRATMVESLWGDKGRVANSPIIQNVWIHNPDLEPYAYDPNRAKELLAKHGWRDTDGDGVLDRDGQPFAFDLMTNEGNRQRIDATVIIQSQLARLGIQATPRILEFQSFVKKTNEGEYDAALSGWTMPTTLDFRYAFHSDEIGHGSNFIAYSNPDTDRLLDQIAAQSELADAEPLLLELQEVLNQQLPYTILWESKRIVGMNRRIRDANPNVLFVHYDLPQWWVDS